VETENLCGIGLLGTCILHLLSSWNKHFSFGCAHSPGKVVCPIVYVQEPRIKRSKFQMGVQSERTDWDALLTAMRVTSDIKVLGIRPLFNNAANWSSSELLTAWFVSIRKFRTRHSSSYVGSLEQCEDWGHLFGELPHSNSSSYLQLVSVTQRSGWVR
jgi:hypothetical protein